MENWLSYTSIKNEKEFRCYFGHNIISNGLYQANRNNIEHKNAMHVIFNSDKFQYRVKYKVFMAKHNMKNTVLNGT